jgi:pyridoxine kinase
LFFSGTGDMFAALTIPRLIEAVVSSSTPDLKSKPSWKSPDDVKAEELPLAKACQKVLASMQSILATTTEKCSEEMARYDARAAKEGHGKGKEDTLDREKRRHLALMNASEVKVPRFIKEINDPPNLERFRPRAVVEVGKLGEEPKAEKSERNLDAKTEAKSAAKSDEETIHDTEGKSEKKPPAEKSEELKKDPEDMLTRPEVQSEEKPSEISAEPEDKSGEKVETTPEEKSDAKSLEKELHSVEQ